jgi:hypothetical protein
MGEEAMKITVVGAILIVAGVIVALMVLDKLFGKGNPGPDQTNLQ